MTESRKICVGVIIGAHGVRGQVRLRSFTDDPVSVFEYGALASEEGKKLSVKCVGVMKDHFIASVKGVSDRDAAEAMRGTKLYVDRAALPEIEQGEYYETDLVGLSAQTVDGKLEGKVLAVHDYGAGSFLEIQPVKGASFMLPFNDECVPSVDVVGGFVSIVVPEGWLEEAKAKVKP